ncbi:hypothetical protein [Enterococcus faecalis]|uniref:hypothetical protein n=1 Tax=Enterococcus faecalis TaxID=1351 RepID=UPI0019F2B317|nr:hypothetical protein [Enterococcus faecalis]EGO5188129.1 hypothetical protein [Enterococcus faecalis]EGO5803037.1 hypothetical protein [Enterococcus faecalis]EGO5828141.1 hypothetical protein [Enterococcus faecalis]EGO6510965.1 hypothetical protein [Enterococcus faecalis]EHA4031863.1 hypothetical protein [Enterococcus faecalis]
MSTKTFIVEVEYQELDENTKTECAVFYGECIKLILEELMEGYLKQGSIKSFSEVVVTEKEAK